MSSELSIDLYAKHEGLVKRSNQYFVKQEYIPKAIRVLVYRNDFSALGTKDDYFKLSPENLAQPLMIMQMAEQYYASVQMRRFDREAVYVEQDGHKWKVELYGLSRGDSGLVPSDFIQLEAQGICLLFKIDEIDGDTIKFRWNYAQDTRRALVGSPFKVSAFPSGKIFAKYYEVIGKIDTRMLFEHPDDQQVMPAKIDVDSTTTESLQERLSRCNDSQRQAIVGILEAKCRPKPYILFGPPGTGKSFTVVEAVVQIHERIPNARILVCANSNNCADQLAAAIDKTDLCDDSLVRLCAGGHFQSLRRDKKWYHLNKDDLDAIAKSEFRVIVTTNNMSYALDGEQFDFVIIDEASHAHIPETFIAATLKAPDGCLVLAGDPKQLGPVIKCRAVDQLGFGVSMLERLFEVPVYTFEPERGGYDPRFITQLTTCYRCDPRILAPCNELFYHQQLTCKGETPPSLLEKLGLDRPLVFHAVSSQHKWPEGDSTSIFNEQEADVCVGIAIRLLKMGMNRENISIISNYKQQRKVIAKKMKERMKTESVKIDEVRKKLEEAKEDQDDYVRLLGELKAKAEEKLSPERTVKKTMKKQRKDGKDSFSDLYDDFDPQLFEVLSKITGQPSEKQLNKWLPKVETVDGFQGRESEVVIISTVRTNPNWDFVADSKRFNVAISRAKWLAVVVGHPAVLQSHQNWQTFKRHATRANIGLN